MRQVKHLNPKAPAQPAPRARAAKKTAPGGPSAEALNERIRFALEELKARDVREIDVRGKSGFTDTLFIASGTSSRHVKSIADEVQKRVKEIGAMPLGVEGEREAEWVLVDLGDAVVHAQATLSLLMRLGLWVFGQIVFTRQRKLGSAK